jgi:hypothetical protein
MKKALTPKSAGTDFSEHTALEVGAMIHPDHDVYQGPASEALSGCGTDRVSDVTFESPEANPTNDAVAHEAVDDSTKNTPLRTMFPPVSRKAAEAAKKGTTSASRTGKARQVSYEFGKPPKGIYVKVHPSPDYHRFNLPVFVNEDAGTFHYVNPELFESGELPERFRNVCKLMDVHTAGCADATFFLWYVFLSSSKWRKAAIKAVNEARRAYVIVSSIKARQTYGVEIADQPIPEPKWVSLSSFEQLLVDAFDSTINVADDKVVLDYMRGGVAAREDEEDVE